MKYLLPLLFLFVLGGCFYSKVSLEKKERTLIAYDKTQKSLVVHSNTGISDTVYFTNIGYRNGYEPNLEVWWGSKRNDSVNRKLKRGFYYSVIAVSNFPKNEYGTQNLNLSLHLRLAKHNNSDNLVLSIDEFEDKFIIDKNMSDTLVFVTQKSPGGCTIWNCTKKIYWSAYNGIIAIEKNDETVWTP